MDSDPGILDLMLYWTGEPMDPGERPALLGTWLEPDFWTYLSPQRMDGLFFVRNRKQMI